jgi:hypothetical protein
MGDGGAQLRRRSTGGARARTRVRGGAMSGAGDAGAGPE